MPLNRLNFILLAGMFAANPVQAQPQADAEALKRRIIEQIHVGESAYRDDIVNDAVQRLYRLEPGHPAGVFAQFNQALRTGKLAEAQAFLQDLEARAPQSQELREARVLLRLSQPAGSQALGQARLLAAAGRVEEARKAYDDLFKGVLPGADYGVEYWQLRAREEGGRQAAYLQLQQLQKTYPRHAALLTVLANLAFNLNQPAQARNYLHQLAKLPGGLGAAATREFDYLSTLPVSAESLGAWREFVALYAGHSLVAKAQAQADRQAALLSDPRWVAGQQGISAIEAGGSSARSLAQLQQAARAYPDDVEVLGALGLAYLRRGDRVRALQYFEQAKRSEPREDQTYRWVSLIDSTRYWLLLEQAEGALKASRLDQAQALYTQATRLDAQDVHAPLGLADVAAARGQYDAALAGYMRVLSREPGQAEALRGIARTLDKYEPAQALAWLDSIRGPNAAALAQTRRLVQLRVYLAQAQEQERAEQWGASAASLEQAQQLDPDDPWLSYRLAEMWFKAGETERGLQAFQRHLDKHPRAGISRYAHGLLLESLDRWSEGLASLERVARTDWTADMQSLAQRLHDRERIEQARSLYAVGRVQDAIGSLEREDRPSNAVRLQIAAWALESGDVAKAKSQYAAVLRSEPENPDAYLGQMEAWQSEGRTATVEQALSDRPASLRDSASVNEKRRLSALYLALGERAQARTLLEQAASQAQGPEPLLYRDLGRIVAKDQPEQALGHFETALRQAGALQDYSAAGQERRKTELTRATRSNESDDWLLRSLRSDTAELYQQQSPVLHLHEDFWGRNDGTPGLSRLRAGTTMAQLDFPLGEGTMYVRADHVRMNAGSFDVETNGAHQERFGTCSFTADDADGNTVALPGCSSDLRQRANGTSFALGYRNGRFAADIGRTPAGFPVENWVGGVSISGDAGPLGLTLTASRRPLSNSLLSFAGARDPRTGITWGGVLATGASLGLSWDQGLAHGVWADLGLHRLTGRNVQGNTRTTLMGGYYHRLINRPHEQLSVGVNALHWRFSQDLGEYTLGQGGYFSPQRFTSLSLPVTYARRTANWSFELQGSVSRSFTRSQASSYYPLEGLVSGPAGQMTAMGVPYANLLSSNAIEGSSSKGWAYSLRGVAERRLDNHWVLGGGIDWQKGKEYAPSRFMLYLRYSFEPWQGDLPLPPRPLTPYADFK